MEWAYCVVRGMAVTGPPGQMPAARTGMGNAPPGP